MGSIPLRRVFGCLLIFSLAAILGAVVAPKGASAEENGDFLKCWGDTACIFNEDTYCHVYLFDPNTTEDDECYEGDLET